LIRKILRPIVPLVLLVSMICSSAFSAQAILFKSEAFAASCRLFLKLAEARSGYLREDFVRTNIYNAFTCLCPARQPIRRLEQSL
jgi:hypothetical protein